MEFNADIFNFCYLTSIIFTIFFCICYIALIVFVFTYDFNKKTNKQRIEDLEKENKKLKCDIECIYDDIFELNKNLAKCEFKTKKQIKKINSKIMGVDKK